MRPRRSRVAWSPRRNGVDGALVSALTALLLSACATLHPLEWPPRSQDLVGRIGFAYVRSDDTLIDLAPASRVGYVELLAANPGVDPWLPPRGTELVLPRARLLPSGRREGIVVNLGDLRLYHFGEAGRAWSYPIGVAKEGFSTPHGQTVVVEKRERPSWYPGPSARSDGYPARVPPGPDNPLGEYALYLGWPAFLIHGTNEPRGVGRHISRGCIRLYPEHIEELYERVAIGTPVRVVNEPIKLGWIGGELHLEANPGWSESMKLDATGARPEASMPRGLHARVRSAAGDEVSRVDWSEVERTARLRSGIPTRITRRAEETTGASGR